MLHPNTNKTNQKLEMKVISPHIHKLTKHNNYLRRLTLMWLTNDHSSLTSPLVKPCDLAWDDGSVTDTGYIEKLHKNTLDNWRNAIYSRPADGAIFPMPYGRNITTKVAVDQSVQKADTI